MAVTNLDPTVLTGLLVGEGSGLLNLPPTPTMIGGVPAAATLELQSTVGAFLIMRLTSAQAALLGAVVDGMLIYVTSTNLEFPTIGLYLHTGGNWVNIGGGGGSSAPANASYLVMDSLNNPPLINEFLVNTPGNNTRLGVNSLNSNIAGTQNTSIGAQSLTLNTVSNNTGCGFNALNLNSTGINNAALGSGALQSNSTGNFNTGVGCIALPLNADASNNTAVGYQSCNSIITGSGNNTAVGTKSLLSLITGDNNCSFGYQSGSISLTANNCTFLGANTTAADGLTNATAIGAATIVGVDNAVCLGRDANVGISEGSPTSGLHFGPVGANFKPEIYFSGYASTSAPFANDTILYGNADKIFITSNDVAHTGSIVTARAGVAATNPTCGIGQLGSPDPNNATILTSAVHSNSIIMITPAPVLHGGTFPTGPISVDSITDGVSFHVTVQGGPVGNSSGFFWQIINP